MLKVCSRCLTTYPRFFGRNYCPSCGNPGTIPGCGFVSFLMAVLIMATMVYGAIHYGLP